MVYWGCERESERACVCERKREREGGREGEREREYLRAVRQLPEGLEKVLLDLLQIPTNKRTMKKR